MKRFWNNAPDEVGTQLLLDEPLSDALGTLIKERFGIQCDYECEYYKGEFESAWINVDAPRMDEVIALLVADGFVEAQLPTIPVSTTVA